MNAVQEAVENYVNTNKWKSTLVGRAWNIADPESRAQLISFLTVHIEGVVKSLEDES
jgi:hypothetical protein